MPVIERSAVRRPHPGAEPIAYPLQPIAAETPVSGEVQLGKGPWRFSMPSMVALAIVTSVGGFATAWLNKPSPTDPAEILRQVNLKIATLQEESRAQSSALMTRVGTVETKVDRIQDSEDRLKDRFNEELLNRYGNRVPPPSALDNAIGRQLQK